MKFRLFFIILLLSSLMILKNVKGENKIIDSLLIELKNSSNDFETNKIKAELGYRYLNIENKQAEEFSLEAYEFSKYSKDDEVLNIKKRASYTLGHIYNGNGDYSKAIKYFIECDEICREVGDTLGMINCENGLGNLYLGDEIYDQSLFHYQRGNDLSKQIKDSGNIGVTYLGIGNVYASLNKHDSALYFYEQGKTIFESKKNQFIYAGILANMAESLVELNQVELALKYNLESLDVMINLNHGYGIAALNQNIGSLYNKQKQYDKALKFYLLSISKNVEIEGMDDLQECYRQVGLIYESLNNKALAYDYFKKHISLKDSLFNEKKINIIAEMQNKYDNELNNAEIKLLNNEKIIQKTRLKAKETQEYVLYSGIFIVLVFSGFMFNRYKISQKQKNVIEETNEQLNQRNEELSAQRDEIEDQRNEVEEKNQQILASIEYAKRIQSAILPTDNNVKKYLPDSFILYKPKDIVAGDFYWLEASAALSLTANDSHTERSRSVVLFAAADCTGHGVPGAMVSVVCNNGLNRSVREYGLTDPGEILDKTREIVIQEFEKSEEEVTDGMDIALCALEIENSKSNVSSFKLSYAGAHNPLWVIRNNELMETKADKQPVGKFDKQFPFTTHSFELQKGDTIYIFSDGFVDQFGGQKSKKFKAKSFKNLLLSIQEKSMKEQKILIDDVFEDWRGDLEQIDDVCIIGVRV